jgi:hypothetical protein
MAPQQIPYKLTIGKYVQFIIRCHGEFEQDNNGVGVESFRPGFRAEKPVSVTASRKRGSPFSSHDEGIARGHPDSVLI